MSEPLKPAVDIPVLAHMGVDPARRLVIVDVDEVLGLFMQGFGRFLEDQGLEFRVEKFALFQNIYRPGETTHLDIAEGRKHFEEFFRDACADMPLAPGGPEALRALAERASIVILTNAPGQAREARARWLARHGMDYPLLLNTGPKGPLVAGLARQAAGPVAFIDDLLPNLDSVADHAPAVARFQTVADERLRPLAPAKPDLHTRIDDWGELRFAIEAALG